MTYKDLKAFYEHKYFHLQLSQKECNDWNEFDEVTTKMVHLHYTIRKLEQYVKEECSGLWSMNVGKGSKWKTTNI